MVSTVVLEGRSERVSPFVTYQETSRVKSAFTHSISGLTPTVVFAPPVLLFSQRFGHFSDLASSPQRPEDPFPLAQTNQTIRIYWRSL